MEGDKKGDSRVQIPHKHARTHTQPIHAGVRSGTEAWTGPQLRPDFRKVLSLLSSPLLTSPSHSPSLSLSVPLRPSPSLCLSVSLPLFPSLTHIHAHTHTHTVSHKRARACTHTGSGLAHPFPASAPLAFLSRPLPLSPPSH